MQCQSKHWNTSLGLQKKLREWAKYACDVKLWTLFLLLNKSSKWFSVFIVKFAIAFLYWDSLTIVRMESPRSSKKKKNWWIFRKRWGEVSGNWHIVEKVFISLLAIWSPSFWYWLLFKSLKFPSKLRTIWTPFSLT